MMRKRIGSVILILGLLLLAAALALFAYNLADGRRADSAAQEILSKLQEQMPDAHPKQDVMGEDKASMPEITIDNASYIGVLQIPELGLQLPVAESWSYPQLRVSPCRFSGSWHTGDLVICAHNYPHHFSPVKNIRPGAQVRLIASDGTVLDYEVLSRETLPPTAIEEMVDNHANSDSTADWDLTLFTCNTGGQTRCAVRCALITA